MKEVHGLGYISDVVAIAMTISQSNETFQIIQLIITIIATLMSILFTSVKLYFWFKDAAKDGKITKDEAQKGAKILKDGINDVKEHLDNIKEKDGKQK